MRLVAGWTALVLAAGLALPVSAENRAVVVANRLYDHAQDAAPPRANDLLAAMRAAGFQVTQGLDQTGQQIRASLADLARPDSTPGTRVVLLTGKFGRSGGQTWFLGTDAASPSLGNADRMGVSLAMVADFAQATGGRTVLVLGDDSAGLRPGAHFSAGVGPLPPGVAVIRGTPEGAVRATQRLLRPGTTLWAALEADNSLELLQGARDFVPVQRLDPSRPAPVPAPTPPAPPRTPDPRPGPTPPIAEPADIARAQEATLQLNRSQRTEIQWNLTALGHDTRGIDGVFGNGTRSAIRQWQTANRLTATGYLTRTQIDMIALQARNRGVAPPAPPVTTPATPPAATDNAAWQEAQRADTPAAMRSYLERFPRGRHATAAQQRLEQLRRYAATESALGLDRTTLMMVETRLAAEGHNPGPQDGVIDARSRAAIASYQRANRLTVTGYLNEQVLTGLLAGALQGIFR